MNVEKHIVLFLSDKELLQLVSEHALYSVPGIDAYVAKTWRPECVNSEAGITITFTPDKDEQAHS